MTQIDWPRARYRLLKPAYMAREPGGVIEMLPEGEIVTFEGRPGVHEGDWMEPLDEAGKRAVEMAKQIVTARDAHRRRAGAAAQAALEAAYDESAIPTEADLLAAAEESQPKRRPGRVPLTRES